VQALGVTTVQGYLTGRPGALSDIRPWSDEITG
jgi:EAL domain-containing protein (putative c-di-GMP-specific phosphodiesterase class I)